MLAAEAAPKLEVTVAAPCLASVTKAPADSVPVTCRKSNSLRTVADPKEFDRTSDQAKGQCAGGNEKVGVRF